MVWFKNIQLFRLAEKFPYSAEELAEKLESYRLQPCGRTQLFSDGWVSPFGNHHSLLVHSANGCHLFAICKEEKILPAAIIKQALDERVTELEQQEQKLSRQEKLHLREEIVHTLLPRAFSRRKVTLAYIDTRNDFLVVDTSSRSRAEELTELLRRSLGSLKLNVLKTVSRPSLVMSKWLLDSHYPKEIQLEDSCEMLDIEKGTGVIKCSQQDLNASEVLGHLKGGKKLARLAMSWCDKLSFVFNDDLSFKRVRFLDLLQDNHETNAESKEHSFLAIFLNRLMG
jgi:recombination associated protein RdgC